MLAYILLAAFLLTLIIVAHQAPARVTGPEPQPPSAPDPPDRLDHATGSGPATPASGGLSGPPHLSLAARPTHKAAGLVAAPPNTPLGRYRGLTASEWAAKYRRRTTQVQQLRRVLFHRSSVTEALNLSCVAYGHCAELWRKARCETGGTYSPRALNVYSGASGLFQFLRSTWNTTPYRVFSVWSPYANALAAGWMHSVGRGGEWVCR